ncbi:Rho termination factor [Nocardioides islandensis]|uniref:Rho termination factor n=1 Tax=Nocardioides islandensis TaxID=433663 RepID=A0A930YKB7_9ACTN|nr:Rho termination factor [Nocardioides islandensis]MBF4765899.1 Rho termination factor [Nocardioides islandensis]
MPARKNHGASIGDDEVYEKVRDQGASKEKAARIANAAANTSRSQVGRKGGEAASYDDWSVAQLRKRAAELEIPGRSSMKRAQLIRALRNG